jgi:hypothetical protein
VKGIIAFVMVIDPYDANDIWYTTWPFGSIVLVLVLVLCLMVFLLLGITGFSFMGLLFSLTLEWFIQAITVIPITHAIMGGRGWQGCPFRSGVLKRRWCNSYSFGEVDCNGGRKLVLLPGQLGLLSCQFGCQLLLLR